MSVPIASVQPQASDILAGLTRTTVAAPPPVALPPVFARLLRPAWSMWLVVCLGLVVLVAMGMLILGWTALHLVTEIRTREAEVAKKAEVPLPMEEVLLDPERYQAVAAAHPDEVVRFGCARAAALAANGSFIPAIEAWREADQWSAAGIPVAERLSLAEILFQQGRHAEAEAEVRRIPLTTVNTEESTWAVDLLGRLQWLRLRGSARSSQR